jgi:uncharacterized protein YndB with AHSA1/START domain
MVHSSNGRPPARGRRVRCARLIAEGPALAADARSRSKCCIGGRIPGLQSFSLPPTTRCCRRHLLGCRRRALRHGGSIEVRRSRTLCRYAWPRKHTPGGGQTVSPETQPLIAEGQVLISSPVSRVWDVIVQPHYIRQWDDVPEDFGASSLALGSVLEWPGSARLTVTVFDPHSRLRLAYHNPTWESPVEGIAYDYELQGLPNGSRCIARVGDWAKAPDQRAQDYYDASVEFVRDALAKIKKLAEG